MILISGFGSLFFYAKFIFFWSTYSQRSNLLLLFRFFILFFLTSFSVVPCNSLNFTCVYRQGCSYIIQCVQLCGFGQRSKAPGVRSVQLIRMRHSWSPPLFCGGWVMGHFVVSASRFQFVACVAVGCDQSITMAVLGDDRINGDRIGDDDDRIVDGHIR